MVERAYRGKGRRTGTSGSYKYVYQTARKLTSAKDEQAEEFAAQSRARGLSSGGTGADYTDLISQPSTWMTTDQISDFANRARNTGLFNEATARAWIADPDSVVSGMNDWQFETLSQYFDRFFEAETRDEREQIAVEQAFAGEAASRRKRRAEESAQGDLFEGNISAKAPVYYASGSNSPAQIRGLAAIGAAEIGVAAPEISKSAEKELMNLAGQVNPETGELVQVFVDSGAFSEVSFPNGVPTVTSPISPAEWDKRLSLYKRLGDTLGAQLVVVAPDQVGFQDQTLKRLKDYSEQMQAISSTGAQVMVPLQGGRIRLPEFEMRARDALGIDNVIPALPMKKGATSVAEIMAYVRTAKPERLHLLGMGERNSRVFDIERMIKRLSPDTVISLDSSLVRASVGRGGAKKQSKRASNQMGLFKAARGQAYRGKGKRTGTPGHYKYVYEQPKGQGALFAMDAKAPEVEQAYTPREKSDLFLSPGQKPSVTTPYLGGSTSPTGKGARMLSLFSGVGGLDLGLERALPDVEHTGFVEWNPYAKKVLGKNWPTVAQHGDVRDISAGAEAGKLKDPPNIITGGFPCTDLSTANQQACGLAGARSGLYYDMERIVRATNPDWVVYENVPQLVNSGLENVLEAHKDMGYSMTWDHVPAVATGAPHKRERVFVVAHRPEVNFKFRKPDDFSHYWEGTQVPQLQDHGTPTDTRVPQIMAAGNAVVPAVGEHIGRMIRESAVEKHSYSQEKAIAVFRDGEWQGRDGKPVTRWPRAGAMRGKVVYELETAVPRKASKTWIKELQESKLEGQGAPVWVRNPNPNVIHADSNVLLGLTKDQSDFLELVFMEGDDSATRGARADWALSEKQAQLKAGLIDRGYMEQNGELTIAGQVVAINERFGEMTSRRDAGGVNHENTARIVEYNDKDDAVTVEFENGSMAVLPTEWLQLYPTPTTSDWKGGTTKRRNDPGAHEYDMVSEPVEPGDPDYDPHHEQRKRGGAIRHWVSGAPNPDMARWLMGFPEGWMDLSDNRADQMSLFDVMKAARGQAYSGKGKRKGTPGHYTYEYKTPQKAKKRKAPDQLAFDFLSLVEPADVRSHEDFLELYRDFRATGLTSDEVKREAREANVSPRQYIVNKMREAEQREAEQRGDVGEYNLERILDMAPPNADADTLAPYGVVMPKAESEYRNIVHPNYTDSPWADPSWAPDLASYDQIVVSSSGGKDSQAMMDRIVELADSQGLDRDSIVVVHADLGRAEWDGTKELARKQAHRYGLRFHVVWRQSGDLLDNVLERFDKLTQKSLDQTAVQLSGVRTWDQLAKLDATTIAALLEKVEQVEVTETSQSAGRDVGDALNRAKKMLTNVKTYKLKSQRKAEKLALEAEQKVSALEEQRGPGLNQKRLESLEKRIQKAQAKAVDLREAAEAARLIDFGEIVPWFSAKMRFCTADHKRAQIDKALTDLQKRYKRPGYKPRILNCQGLRAQESASRADKPAFHRRTDKKGREEDVWYPIQSWSEEKVWDRIKASGTPYAKSYDLGMSRLSCVFCVMASDWDLRTAAYNNPDLLEEYIEVEAKTGKSFKPDMSMSELKAWLRSPSNVSDLKDYLRERQGSKLYLPGSDMGGLIQIGEPLSKSMQRYLERLFRRTLIEIENQEGLPVEKVVFDYKATGACLHFDTAMRSIHVTYFPYPHAYGAAIEIFAISNKIGLLVEEHGAPNES